MKIKPLHKHLLIAGGLVVAAALLVICQPGPSFDPHKVHPRLTSLKEPYREVRSFYYFDGGSIGIEIVDRDGKKEQFAIPALLGEPKPHTRVFVGGIHCDKPAAVEIANPDDTRNMLVCILAEYPRRTTLDDMNLAILRGYIKDRLKLLYYHLRNDFDR